MQDVVDFRETEFTLKCDWIKCMSLFYNLPVQFIIQVLILDFPDVFTESCLSPPVLIPEGAVVGIEPLLPAVGPPSVVDSGVIDGNVVLVQGDHLGPINNIFVDAVTI